jgi:hypothetical protein
MQSRYMRYLLAAAQRKMKIVNVKMDDIKLCCALKQMLKHQGLMRQLIYTMFIEA